MKIAFRKISNTPKNITLEIQGVKLEGEIVRIDSCLLRLDARIHGELELICDSSGEDYMQKIDDTLVLYISEGIWDIQNQNKKLESFDVIEFFDGFVDLHYILESEIESIKSDYHTKED